MIRSRLDQELQVLNTEMLAMGAMCEKAIQLADKGLMEGNTFAASQAVTLENEIRQKGKSVEALCLRMLLLQQPMASDLRAVSAALKMITDMARIGEIASDMSEIIVNMNGRLGILSINDMAAKTSEMVSDVINAFVHQDPELARRVINADDEVDQLFLKTRSDIIERIIQTPDDGAYAVDLVMISKYYEKIGDHAVNIAGWVIYSITGEQAV